MDLRDTLVKLAHEKPEMRPFLVPLLREVTSVYDSMPLSLDNIGKDWQRQHGFDYEVNSTHAPNQYTLSMWDPTSVSGPRGSGAEKLQVTFDPGYGYMIMAGARSREWRTFESLPWGDIKKNALMMAKKFGIL